MSRGGPEGTDLVVANHRSPRRRRKSMRLRKPERKSKWDK